MKEMMSEWIELQIEYLFGEVDQELFTKVLATEGTSAWENYSKQIRLAAKLWNWKEMWDA